MTEAEIKKDLLFVAHYCHDEYNEIRVDVLLLYALDLINRQQAEIERLEQNLKEAHIDIKEHRAEIERLNGEVATYKRIGDKKTEAVIQHDDFIRDLHKEIERLTERNFELAEKGEAVCIAYKTARAEVTEQLSKKIESRLAHKTDISNAQYQSIIFDISEACKEMVDDAE